MLYKSQKHLCYNLEGLLKLLPNYKLVRIKTIFEDEDGSQTVEKSYFTTCDNIEKIYRYHSLGTSVTIYFNQIEETITTYSKNIRFEGSIRYTIEFKELSPYLRRNGNLVYAENDLIAWLHNVGISDENLNSISSEIDIYRVYEYEGVYTPTKVDLADGQYWGYTSSPLRLTSVEISQILDYIQDDRLRKCTEEVLTAPYFVQRPNKNYE